MKKIKLLVITAFILISFVIFSEIIILKNGNEIKGKIIKMDEDTMTILTKTDEIVIDKDEVANIYYDEKKYEEDKNKKNNIPEKKEITGPYIISSIPENGAIDILRNIVKTITIKFNEDLDKSLSYESSEEINKPKWLDSQTLQIELKEYLDYGETFKLVLNPSGKRQIMKTKLKTLLPPDTVYSFTTKEVKWTPIYTENFNRADTENGNIGPDWEVNNYNGSATVKIENNELVMSKSSQYQIMSYIEKSNKILIGSKDGIKFKIKFKNEYLALRLFINTESYQITINNNILFLNHFEQKYPKVTECTLLTNKYYTAEIFIEKSIFLCIVKNENNTFIRKLSIDISENILPSTKNSSIKLFIIAGGNKVPFVYIDDLEVSVY